VFVFIGLIQGMHELGNRCNRYNKHDILGWVGQLDVGDIGLSRDKSE